MTYWVLVLVAAVVEVSSLFRLLLILWGVVAYWGLGSYIWIGGGVWSIIHYAADLIMLDCGSHCLISCSFNFLFLVYRGLLDLVVAFDGLD